MKHKILLAELSTPVVIALLKRAIADRWHAEHAVRDNATRFMQRVSPRLFKTPSFRHLQTQVLE